MEIEVTQEDIDKGVSDISNECAVALALRRKFKTNRVVVLVNHAKTIRDNEHTLTFKVRDKLYKEKHIDKLDHVRNFILDFDRGVDVVIPFKFSLNLNNN